MFSLLKNFFGSKYSNNLAKLLRIREAQLIFSILKTKNDPFNTRFVGGCVRKAILDQQIDDIDLATSLKPEEVKSILQKNKIQFFETGLSHGTLTIIKNNLKFEITTLRSDISTDGRHAEVAFISDWHEDALRRDFTVNSIYVDRKGKIFDPFNGIEDLKNGTIKFIGNCEERIKEDYLRILRYFRFFLEYSKLEHDPNVIKIIKKNLNGLNHLSKERIFDEIKKIANLKNFSNIFINDLSKDIFKNIFPELKYTDRLLKINKLDLNLKKEVNNILILAFLSVDKTNNGEYFYYKYKTSTKIKKIVDYLKNNFDQVENDKMFSKNNLRKLLYFGDYENVRYLCFLSFSINDNLKESNLIKALDYLKNCSKPVIPITASDLKIKYGFKEGKELGAIINKIKDLWISNNFEIDEKKIERLINKKK